MAYFQIFVANRFEWEAAGKELPTGIDAVYALQEKTGSLNRHGWDVEKSLDTENNRIVITFSNIDFSSAFEITKVLDQFETIPIYEGQTAILLRP